jgi:hypothetical protein
MHAASEDHFCDAATLSLSVVAPQKKDWLADLQRPRKRAAGRSLACLSSC